MLNDMEREGRNGNDINNNEDPKMRGFRPSLRAMMLVVAVIWVVVAALYDLLKPISNGCVMTYMHPTYIPISTTEGISSAKYGLYLYHEGWRKIDFTEHLKKLNGIPILFIPGNGGSYKQVLSLAAESDRAYQGGPLEHTFYREAYLASEEGGNVDVADFQLPNQYANRLDWFAVDLEGEQSAMDGQILEEHTEYVVYAIHRILDQYKELRDAWEREGAATTGSLPRSVILVGHSVDGFVARAATIHPHLRKSAVDTILTLSSPHQAPPVAMQPSLSHCYESINQDWRQGYKVQTTRSGHYVSGPKLSDVIVVSISGGYNGYQVRSKLESLDGISPPTHGFMVSSTSMKNAWLSMEHQAILWCNQLVVQGSNGKSHFIFATNLAPCSGVRVQLWPQKGKSSSDLPAGKRVLEVTSKVLQIPAGPAPRQIEPGSRTEQAPPSAVLHLGPEEMHVFRFLAISVSPCPTVSGRSPPAASMEVGQFFNPDEGKIEFSPVSMLLSTYSPVNIFLKEDHPLAFNLSFAISVGLLPVTVSLKTADRGIKDSGLLDETGDMDNTKLCDLRCFPPVALAWDPRSALHVFPNLYSETLVVDSSPTLWTYTGAEKTIVLVLLDQHFSLKASISVSVTTAASRYLLLYCSQIAGFSVVVIFFALMRQADARPIPSTLKAMETNLKVPLPFVPFAVVPILFSLFFSFLTSQPFPSFSSFTIVSIICYLFANWFIILLVLVSQLVFYVAAYLHVIIKRRWQLWEVNVCVLFLQWFMNLSSRFFSLKVARVLRANTLFIPMSAAIILSTFLHPALSLFIMLVSCFLLFHFL